jgi:hypothetical protein
LDVGVDLVLYAVHSRLQSRARLARLVLRRTVFLAVSPDAETWVEELWLGERTGAAELRPALRAALAGRVAGLLLAQPVELPGLSPATAEQLGELTRLVDGRASVRYLAGCRGTIEGGPGRPDLTTAEVVGGPGVTAHVARSLLRDAVTDLGLVPTTPSIRAEPDEPTSSRVDPGPEAGPESDDDPATAPAEQPGVRAELLRDLADARDRLDQADRWQRLADASLSLSALPDTPPSAPGPEWSSTARDLPGPATLTADDDPDEDCVIATFVGVDGGVVGEHPLQTNLFSYRLSPRIDLRQALRRAAVRAAFTAYARHAARPDADPQHCAELREQAVAALRTALPEGSTDWREGERPVGPRPTRTSESVPTLHGTVILQDCRAIQVGNHVRQFNTFGYVLAPDVDVGALLRAHPDVVEAIVDYACAVDGPNPRSIQRQLADAVCGLAEGDLLRPARSTAFAYGATVHDTVGVMVASHGKQSDVASVRVDPLTRVTDAMGGLQRRLAAERNYEEQRRASGRDRVANRQLADPYKRTAPSILERYFTTPDPGSQPRRGMSGPSLDR